MASFRHSAGFGKRIQFWNVGQMLKEGMDVYMPLVNDHAVDAIIKRKDGTIAQVQIKARSRECLDRASSAVILRRKVFRFPLRTTHDA